MPANAPSLQDLKDWLGLPEADAGDDLVLQSSLDAALESQAQIVVYPRDDFGEELYTADLTNAIYLRSVRLASRRNSPESVVGISGGEGDFISVRLPGVDVDVNRLESPYMRIVSA